jgi:uncharacterized membrane protein
MFHVFDYFHVLLFLHITGALLAFGPTFAFPITLGGMAKVPGEAALALYRSVLTINSKMVVPLMVIQPLTGALLVFESGRNETFFQREWLWIASALYLVLLGLVVFVDRPAGLKLVAMMEKGETADPGYEAARDRQNKLGMSLGMLVLAILVLMVFKPGDIG